MEDETNNDDKLESREKEQSKKVEKNHTSSQTSNTGADRRKDTNVNIFLLVCIVGVSLGILLEIINVRNGKQCDKNHARSRKYWVYTLNRNFSDSKNTARKHVHRVLERLGYQMSGPPDDWDSFDLLWAHDYPFRKLEPNLFHLKPGQKVNHFPATAYITNKVDLSTSGMSHMPRAFRLPKQKTAFLEYAAQHPEAMFLEKNNKHRGVKLKNVTEVDAESGEKFVQEYVQRPLLVGGRRFDIGVYVVLTSVQPLRVYWYTGDVLFRYCPEEYYPFDPTVLDKYVVGDDYMPTWDVPSLEARYLSLGFGMKDSFDDYLREQGKDPNIIWERVKEAITEVFVANEKYIVNALKNYAQGDNFFELMRLDLVSDEDLNVFLLEANMSPNLDSGHFPPNRILYEQVLYSLFSLVGVSSQVRPRSQEPSELRETSEMVSAFKNIAVPEAGCGTRCFQRCDAAPACTLCPYCLKPRMRDAILRAHTEHLHRADFRRLYPLPMKPNTPLTEPKNLSEANKVMNMWYQAKCNMDPTWCM